MADPVFVAVASGAGTTGGDATVTKPGAVQDGHFLVAFITSPNSAANAPTNPDGTWTDHPDSLTAECRLAYKFANGEPASWTWVVPGLSTGQVTVVAFSGVDPADPFGEIQGTLIAASAGDLVLDGLTPTASYLYQMVVKHIGTAQSWTPPGAVSEDYDGQSSGSPTYAIGGGHETVTPGVATGTRTWDPSNTGNNSIRGYMFTLNPVPIPATVNAVTATATAEGKVPDYTRTAAPAPPAAQATASAPAAVVSAEATVAAAVAEAAAQALLTTESWGAVLFPPAAAAAAQASVPAYANDYQITGVPVATAVAEAWFASIVATSQVLDPQAVAAAQAHAPEVSADANVEAPAAEASAGAHEPTYSFELNALIEPPTATAFGLNPLPTVSATAIVEAVTATAAAQAYVPDPAASAVVLAPRAQAAAMGRVPGFTRDAEIFAPTALALAIARAARANYQPQQYVATALLVPRVHRITHVPRTISIEVVP